MIVYAIVILFILILRLTLNNNKVGFEDYRRETVCLRVVCFVLVLLAALRGSSVGTDTIAYIQDYEFTRKASFGEVAEHHKIGAGYYWLCKLFSLTGLSIHWWFGAVASFYIYAIYKFIQKYSTDKLVSVLCFFTVGLYTFSLAGLKQTMAMGFVLFAFMQIDDKKYIRALVCGILAYWCHSATSIFLFGIMLYFLRNKKYYYLVLVTLFFIIAVGGSWLWQFSIGLLEDEHYSMYAEADNIYSSWTMVFYVLLLAIMCLPWRNYAAVNSENSRVLYGMTILAVSFQSLATSYSTAFRVAYYFTPFMCILIPNCCRYMKGESSQRMLKITLCAISIFWMLYTGRESKYLFFMQE